MNFILIVIILLIAIVIILSIVLGLLISRRGDSTKRESTSQVPKEESPKKGSEENLNTSREDTDRRFDRSFNFFGVGIAVAIGGVSVFVSTLTLQKQNIEIYWTDFLMNGWFWMMILGLCLAGVGILFMRRARQQRSRQTTTTNN